jgi:hypothetical protein
MTPHTSHLEGSRQPAWEQGVEDAPGGFLHLAGLWVLVVESAGEVYDCVISAVDTWWLHKIRRGPLSDTQSAIPSQPCTAS